MLECQNDELMHEKTEGESTGWHKCPAVRRPVAGEAMQRVALRREALQRIIAASCELGRQVVGREDVPEKSQQAVAGSYHVCQFLVATHTTPDACSTQLIWRLDSSRLMTLPTRI
eukprot:SAG11_NODE_3880_length_2171_cov_2.482625_3_plen_115_part_00